MEGGRREGRMKEGGREGGREGGGREGGREGGRREGGRQEGGKDEGRKEGWREGGGTYSLEEVQPMSVTSDLHCCCQETPCEVALSRGLGTLG